MWMLKDLDFDKIVKTIDDDLAQTVHDFKKYDSLISESENAKLIEADRRGMVDGDFFDLNINSNKNIAAAAENDNADQQSQFNASHAKDFYKHKER